MDTELGAWLRRKREENGWARREMARRLVDAGKAAGDTAMPSVDGMYHNVHRWEQEGGVSERHKLHYCRAFGIHPSQFGPRQPGEPHETGAAAETAAAIPAVPGAMVPVPVTVTSVSYPGPLTSSVFAYRGREESFMGDSMVQREVLMAAHEGSGHAEDAEQRGIGDATLEQLGSDVVRLSREYMTGEPFPLFLEMRRIRGRMHDALDRRMWPRDATQLYFLLGCVNCLMANVASDLDNPQAAEELARSGWAYAVAIDHRPLMAQLRLSLTDIAYWHGQSRRAADLARGGLQYLENGPTAAQLHLKYARAAASSGETDAAQRAIADAREAHETDYGDDLLEIGGEFRLSWASHHSLAGSALIEIPGAESDAAAELEQAAQLYQTGEPDQVFRYTLEARARIDLGTARLRAGALDAASDALAPVLGLPPAKRTLELPQRMRAVRRELAQPIFRSSAQARELDEQIEDFGAEAITTGLAALPGTTG
jgi:hypothetical protein